MKARMSIEECVKYVEQHNPGSRQAVMKYVPRVKSRLGASGRIEFTWGRVNREPERARCIRKAFKRIAIEDKLHGSCAPRGLKEVGFLGLAAETTTEPETAVESESAARLQPLCWVYMFRCGDKFKIGISENVPRRLASLQGANPERLVVEHKCSFPNRGEAEEIERALHRLCAPWRLSGEWFSSEAASVAGPYLAARAEDVRS